MLKKMFFAFGVFLLLFSCSIDKMQEQTLPINGVDGRTSLAKVTNEKAGDNCQNGGVKLEFGLDLNGDGVLNDDEVQSTAYTCNGIDGKDGISTLVEVQAIDGNVECPNGGVLVITGVDKNGNSSIDDGELVSSVVVCSGIDGISSTIKTEEVPATETTPGGHWLHIYEDDVLVRSIFVGNGKNGINGKDGKDGINGIDGVDGKDGVSVTITTKKVEGGYILYITSIDGTEEIFLKDGKDGTNGLDGINGIDGVDGKDGINGIDGIDGKDGVSVKVLTEKVQGGYYLYITSVDGTEKIFLADGKDGTNGLDGLNGKDGVDGSDGVNGIDGIDGKDGVSVKVTTEKTEGGYYLYITSVDGTEKIFLADGQDGANGLDGLNGIDGVDGTDGVDGIDGKDGISSTIRTEETEGGYYLYITVGTETEKIFVANGKDGTNGLDGTDGVDGVSSTIRTEKVEPSFEYPYGGYYLYITVGDVTEKIFVSNGADGSNGLNGIDGEDGVDGINTVYKVIPNFPNENSTTIKIGYDTNKNGILDDIEVIDNIVVSDGADGTDGTNGISSFIYVYNEEPGEICEYGGYVIVTGMDSNMNGVLDIDESTYTYVCSCGCPSDDDTKKVPVCHKLQIGNDWKFVTLYLPQSAVQAHIDHGDQLGKCN